MRIVLLNGLPLNAFPFSLFSLNIKKVDIKNIKEEVEYYTVSGVRPIISNYIRHPATVKLLADKLGIELSPNPGIYQYVPGDRIYVVVLNSPQRGQDVMQITQEDITIYKIQISEVVR